MNFEVLRLGGHVFQFNIGDYICKYCNFVYYDYRQREAGFPKCLDENEKIIKDIIE